MHDSKVIAQSSDMRPSTSKTISGMQLYIFIQHDPEAMKAIAFTRCLSIGVGGVVDNNCESF